MKTVDEKLRYNRERGGEFSVGYVLGVTFYRGYTKQDKNGKQTISELIDTNSRLAKSGDNMSKGFMCAVRDCANERKAKKQ